MYENATHQQYEQVQPQVRYAMISERAYLLGEERRRKTGISDPMRDWMEAEEAVDRILFGP